MSGLYHVPGNEKLSKYTFAKKVARVFGLDENLINMVSIESAIKKAQRPKDLSLNSSKIRGEGFRLNDVEGDLKIMKKELPKKCPLCKFELLQSKDKATCLKCNFRVKKK